MDYAILEWRDGQPYSPQYDDIYYSRADGRSESTYVFLKHNGLPQRWQGVDRFVIAETGFGTGLNFMLTVQQWLNTTDESACLHYIGIEKHPVAPTDIHRLSRQWPDLAEYYDALLADYPLPVNGQHIRRLFDGRVELQLIFMDVLDALGDRKLAVDSWYLDGFGPAKNPDLWNDEVFRLLQKNSKQGTSLSTYTCAGKVRRGLQSVGFEVERVKGHGAKREMISAVMNQIIEVDSSTPWYQYPSTKSDSRHAIVLGAGLAGLATAWSLIERGWRVTLVDRHAKVAAEASGNLAGLVMPRLSLGDAVDEQFYSSAFLHARHRLEQLNSMLDKPAWFETGVVLGLPSAKAEKIARRYDYNHCYLQLRSDAAADYISVNASGLITLPAAGWAFPGRVCEAMVIACGAALIRLNADIFSMQQKANGWTLYDAENHAVASADVVVLANGTDANQLEATSWLPINSVRGQVTLIPASEKSQRLKQAISVGSYLTPAYNGVHVAGASYSLTNKNSELLVEDQQQTLQHLQQLMPGVFSTLDELTGRVGFRAVSTDRVPLVGAVPDYDAYQSLYKELHLGRRPSCYAEGEYLSGLYITAGHGSRGLSSCFLSAEIVASMIEGAPLPVGKRMLDYLGPARFPVRELRRNR